MINELYNLVKFGNNSLPFDEATLYLNGTVTYIHRENPYWTLDNQSQGKVNVWMGIIG